MMNTETTTSSFSASFIEANAVKSGGELGFHSMGCSDYEPNDGENAPGSFSRLVFKSFM